ncbi:hypothetical protein QYF61_001067 [Mycteria americana]|uniref:ribonuclease H n=1 Tax=Mycteria americana TaxID=33587 RepID=A0AAN7MIC1_MYCAM|nr:hypothetical protein QYF61_001067 [Mycteria americana]
MLFIGQAAADIRKKLQKVEGVDGMTISQLLSIAYKLHIPPETAWKAQICLLTEKDPNEEMNILEEVVNVVTPLVWASKKPGRAKNATPVKTELKPGAQPCQSEFNTPILPVKKPILLNIDWYRTYEKLMQGHNTYSTVLDLKDAFFCIPVDEQSQTIFAFEWENPSTGRKTQLCWTVLPQGFKNNPALFGNLLAKELELWQNDHDAVTLLQYVDDLLIGSDSYEACLEATTSLLNFLGLAGYRVSKKKAQIGKKKVQYMGFEITKGQRIKY